MLGNILQNQIIFEKKCDLDYSPVDCIMDFLYFQNSSPGILSFFGSSLFFFLLGKTGLFLAKVNYAFKNANLI